MIKINHRTTKLPDFAHTTVLFLIAFPIVPKAAIAITEFNRSATPCCIRCVVDGEAGVPAAALSVANGLTISGGQGAIRKAPK